MLLLSERERIIIEQRRLTEEGATLESLGVSLKISKERVRQIEQIAIGKLRDAMLSEHARSIGSPNPVTQLAAPITFE